MSVSVWTRRTVMMAAAAAFSTVAFSAQAEPVPVVASFSVLADVVKQVGGADVNVTTIVGPDGDSHTYEPSPKDAQALKQAQVLFSNGVNLEPWLPRLKKASGFKGLDTVASKGVKLRPFVGDLDGDHSRPGHTVWDPHVWQNVANVKVYVKNIQSSLSKVDPQHAAGYAERAAAYDAKLDALDAKIRAAIGALPKTHRTLVTTHDAFGYFGAAYGLKLIAPIGLSTEDEPSAADIAKLIKQIKTSHIPAVFLENMASPKLMEQLARDSGAKVGGELYSDSLGKPGTPGETYLGMMDANTEEFVKALAH